VPADPNAPPLPDDLVELVARRFAALGDPVRVRLLDALRRRGEASVGELAEEVQAGYANVAKHLGLLHERGVLARCKAGNRTLYRIADPTVLALCETVCGALTAQVRELDALLSGIGAGAIDEEEATR
jgi:DNA-binding transcriptional ArsR family regulator